MSARSFTLALAAVGLTTLVETPTALAQGGRDCAVLASVEEWNGSVDFSWAVDLATGEGMVQALHQASVGVRLLGRVQGGRGAYHGQATGNIIVQETIVEFSDPTDRVTTIEGRGPDQSTPEQGGVLLEVDLTTCQYRVSWPMDLAAATIVSDGSPVVSGFNLGRFESALRALGEGTISQAAPFDVYSLLAPPAQGVEGYVVVTPGGFGAVVSGGEVPPAAVSWRLTPGPLQGVELVVTASPNDWLPEAGDDELTPGNSLRVDAELRNVDGTRPPAMHARRMTFKIARTSHEPGIALNAPKMDAKTTADLQFDQELNASPDIPLDVSGEEKETAQTRAGVAPFDEASAYVSAFDYGAFGEVTVSAELEDGTSVQGLVGGIQGETTLLVPRRTGPFVAAAWKQRAGVPDLADDEDAEASPDGYARVPGDGFSLYEEYRGVMVGDPSDHLRMNPTKRDFFVIDPTRNESIRAGVRDYRDATQLEVHAKLTPDQAAGASHKVVNFNHSARVPHTLDQEASRIAFVPDSPLGFSEARAASGAAGLSTPRDTELVIIRGWTPPGSYLDARLHRVRRLGDTTTMHLRRTTMHELLHSTNVDHHGEADPGFREWSEENGRIVERQTDREGRTVPGTETEIDVVLENGRAVTAAELGLPLSPWVGEADQQHSGNETCAMRYTVAEAKISRGGGRQRIWTGREAFGLDLCASAEGTGVNDPQRILQSGLESRFGDATKGDCQHQIVVKDVQD